MLPPLVEKDCSGVCVGVAEPEEGTVDGVIVEEEATELKDEEEAVLGARKPLRPGILGSDDSRRAIVSFRSLRLLVRALEGCVAGRRALMAALRLSCCRRSRTAL